MKTKRILFVLTSFDEVKTTGHKTGVWIEEFVAPYYLLRDKGLDITIATPKGGKAPIDPKSLLPDFATAAVQKFTGDKETAERLNNTVKLTDLNLDDYDAVCYPGGHGPMWDLPQNKESIHIIESFYAKGKPVALVCHAPAALQNVKAANGDALVKGKKVAGFTNSEEIAGKSVAEAPYLLEDMLKDKGAEYVRGEDWKGFAIADGNLITGQNPASSELVAEKILEALGI
ncbi:type 1 glutamine amidotransferase domain-containing protein [Pedobacter nototheniae]|uniref:type 1 glutamine amidotransferase domain-containing protein n=1 Tax=Pedobacter nototheniae TaxID=2488994 RepID=UPI00292DDBF5|nr:type 1 glutamine amidotransferase domain-containing protein [Pedobacter nototheniae]